MAFYDLPKSERERCVTEISEAILSALRCNRLQQKRRLTYLMKVVAL